MNIDNRWFVLLAAAALAALGATIAATTRRDNRAVKVLDHKGDLKAWENEGGSLAPVAVPAIR